MNPIISVRNLSKKYIIGENIHGRGARTFRDIFDYKTKHLFRRDVKRNKEDTTIWALKDVSFDVDQGEVVGIIGRNGAGKSTLLKILSRITEPTTGEVTLRGRVASLLEVGTGFNQELTGRENIFLNGSILGMKKTEIKNKFDEIVAFSEIERFIDTPVKRYSSGMYVRLAFAVAAHLEPEILLVDEVLAVGDAGFQKKCLGKMGDVARRGRTVLFVSHNMTAIQSLCGRSILVGDGRIHSDGNSTAVIAEYLSAARPDGVQEHPGEYDLSHRENPYLPGSLIAKKLYLTDCARNPRDVFLMGQEMYISIDVQGMSEYRDAIIGVILKSDHDQWITGINSGMICSHIDQPRQQNEQAVLRIPKVPLVPGSYWIDASIAQQGIGRIDYVERAARFTVMEADVYGSGYQVSGYFGMVYLEGSWAIRGQHT